MFTRLPVLVAGLLAVAGIVRGSSSGSVAEPNCDGQILVRSVGYYDARSSDRSCDKRLPSDIDILPFTHINFAYAFFHPTTFQILPMQVGDEALYVEFTALKLKKPSLKTWISIGGRTFSEPTNTPNTQTAFSDMVSNATNRQAFINSLRNFMLTYAFDGVDIDWQYPGAQEHDRNSTDSENFVTLLHELKDAFQGKYGISVTMPGNNAYLENFNLTGMQSHIDFFNFATYDIHDTVERHYAYPNSNFDQVKKQVKVLRTQGVDLAKVNFGIGWYGRSYTLKDPDCNAVDCFAVSSGRAGNFTQLPGILSHAEIRRINEENGLTLDFDSHAVAKLLTWDIDQWVSYDDAETVKMKIDTATSLCLGGVNVWSMDLDGPEYTSSNDLLRALGAITPAGASPDDIDAIRTYKDITDRDASIKKSCYWSSCGGYCEDGWMSFAHSKGHVPSIPGDKPCRGDDVRSLCCAPGTRKGKCEWFGWRGVGMPCGPKGCPEGRKLVGSNTNSYQEDVELAINENYTCNGGVQSFCCSGFMPSLYTTTDSLDLLRDNEWADEYYENDDDADEEGLGKLLDMVSNNAACLAQYIRAFRIQDDPTSLASLLRTSQIFIYCDPDGKILYFLQWLGEKLEYYYGYYGVDDMYQKGRRALGGYWEGMRSKVANDLA
ncbi:glycosyl hydrolases family 18-domain-containing protein [Aspergillus oleicola]